MPRRDDLTYDVGQPPTRGPVPWLPLLVLVAVLALGTLLVAGVVRSGGDAQAAPAPTPTPSASSTPVPPTTASSPLPSGSDAAEGLPVPEGSQQAASAFIAAWLDADKATRAPALQETASPALAEELMLTDPAKVPRATPRGAPRLADASTYSVQFTQPLSSGMEILVYLVADPASRYGWLATSVEQA